MAVLLTSERNTEINKHDFRKKALAVRNSLDTEDRKRKDSVILNRLLENEQFKRAACIGAYYSCQSEVDTTSLISASLKLGKKVYLPKVSGERTLKFYRINSLSDTISGYKGIFEPDEERCEELADSNEIGLLIVPGVAFDENLNRMGYGKGFYDGFLRSFQGYTIGLAYSEQLYKSIPADENDERLDMVITDKEIKAQIPEKEPFRQFYFIELAKGFLKELEDKKGGRVTYHVTTFGCQMNARDSEKLSGILESIGFLCEESEEEADFVIFNTCTVRDNADQRLYGRLGHLKGERYENPNRIIALCGCMMQEKSAVEKIRKSYPYVDIIFGTHNIYKLAELFCIHEQSDSMVVDILEGTDEIVEDIPSVRKYPFKSGVNIMFGCDNFCSYCIVPYVRGRERSREPKDIIREIEKLSDDGVVEVMLLGQNVNSYGRGLENPISFAALLKEVEKIEGIKRIRFMTSHPKDLSDELIETIRDSEKICRHIHLPLQSGSSRILKLMNRKYTKESYLELAEKIRREIPDIAITTDIIVGFPGETEEDVDDTLDVIKKVGYDGAFTFIYSKRANTPAAEMEGQVSKEESRRQFDRVLKAVQDSSKERAAQRTGEVYEVLAEEVSDHDPSYISGRLSSNLVVHFKGGRELIGSIARVKLTECRGFYYLGEML